MQRVAWVLITSVLFAAQESLSQSCEFIAVYNISSAVNFSSVLYPGNPGQSLPNLDCYWMFGPSSADNLVAMEFIDANLGFSEGCEAVSVSVYGVTQYVSYLLEKICGPELPDRIVSNGSSSYFYVNFRTNADESYLGQGFRARVFQIPKPSTSTVEPTTTHGTTESSTVDVETTELPTTSVTADTSTAEAHTTELPTTSVSLTSVSFGTSTVPSANTSGGIIVMGVNSTGQFFSSDYYPGYPNKTTANLHCAWQVHAIDAGNGVGLLLEFNQTSIEYSENCNVSVVRVYDGNNTHSPLLLESCGPNTPSPITTSGNFMFVEFKTFTESQNQGILARVRAFPLPTTSTTTTTWLISGYNVRGPFIGATVLSFEIIAIIIGGISIVLISILGMIVCFNKASAKKLKAKISADQRLIQIVPIHDTDKPPVLPDKPVSKSPKSPRNDENSAGTSSGRSSNPKRDKIEEVQRQSQSPGKGQQKISRIAENIKDNMTPVDNRTTNPQKRSPQSTKRVPAARRAFEGLT